MKKIIIGLLCLFLARVIYSQCPANQIISCKSFVNYSQTSNMPATTKVADYVDASNNAWVLSGQNVNFEAGQKIILRDGFWAKSGSNFVSKIKQCPYDPTLIPTICVESIADLCTQPNFRFTAVIYGGSGNFSYAWSNGLGNNRTVNANISGSTTITLGVVDNVTGTTVIVNSTVNPNNFYSGFSVNSNMSAFSPNGDGLNDIFYIPSTAPDPNSAYNATNATLTIWDRWGSKIYETSRSGHFRDSDLNWVGNGQCWTTTYYWTLDLSNCAGSQGFSGSVTQVNCRMEYDETAKEELNTTKTEVSNMAIHPNPITSGYLNFGHKVRNYTLMNSTGAVMQQGTNAEKLDVTGLSKGMYILKLDNKIEKVIVE